MAQFDAKMRLYREATVLMLLTATIKTEPKYKQVLTTFEGFILPDQPTYEGMVKLETLRDAMRHLTALLNPQGQGTEFSWSMGWLAGIGRKETNPVRLMHFSIYWMTTYEAVAKSIAHLRPE